MNAKEKRLEMIDRICELDRRLYHTGDFILKMKNIKWELDVSSCNPDIMLSYVILATSCRSYDEGENNTKKECQKFFKNINTLTVVRHEEIK